MCTDGCLQAVVCHILRCCHLLILYNVGEGWMSMEHWQNDNEWGRLKYLEKNHPSPISIITWTGLGLNQGLCSEREVTNHPRHGTSPKGSWKWMNMWVPNVPYLHFPLIFMNSDIFTTSKPDKMAKWKI